MSDKCINVVYKSSVARDEHRVVTARHAGQINGLADMLKRAEEMGFAAQEQVQKLSLENKTLTQVIY